MLSIKTMTSPAATHQHFISSFVMSEKQSEIRKLVLSYVSATGEGFINFGSPFRHERDEPPRRVRTNQDGGKDNCVGGEENTQGEASIETEHQRNCAHQPWAYSNRCNKDQPHVKSVVRN